MVFSLEDKGVIKALFQEKGWRGKRIVQELPGKNWNRQSVNRLIDKFIKTGTTDRAQGSGRPRSRTGYVDEVEDLIASQEDRPGTHLSQRKIAQNLGISRGTVQNIVKKDIKFKTAFLPGKRDCEQLSKQMENPLSTCGCSCKLT